METGLAASKSRISAHFSWLTLNDVEHTRQDKEHPRRFVRIVGPAMYGASLDTGVSSLHINAHIAI